MPPLACIFRLDTDQYRSDDHLGHLSGSRPRRFCSPIKQCGHPACMFTGLAL